VSRRQVSPRKQNRIGRTTTERPNTLDAPPRLSVGSTADIDIVVAELVLTKSPHLPDRSPMAQEDTLDGVAHGTAALRKVHGSKGRRCNGMRPYRQRWAKGQPRTRSD